MSVLNSLTTYLSRVGGQNLLRRARLLMMCLAAMMASAETFSSSSSVSMQAAMTVQEAVPETSTQDSFEVKLALEIVHKYRALRARCHALPDDQKNMCFYRMKIGNWDYKEAKAILARHKLI